VRELLIANRGSVRSHTLAERLGGEVVAWEDRQAALGRADVVISSTGARGLVVSTADLVQAQRGRESRALVVVDLALPRDVEPGAATVPGVRLLDLAHLGTLLGDAGHHPQVQAATDLVTAEVAEYLTMRSAETVAPTVSALRRRAEDVVAAELTRLERRLPDLDPAERDEVAKAVHRVVEKLLHAPTVRVKEFAEQGRGGSYARALHELFDLDPRDVSLVSAPVPLVLDPEEGP
jgi:glutamyl-tRNA reductase